MPSSVTSAIATNVRPAANTHVRIGRARAVRSKDYSSLFFVSAKLELPNADGVATWATDRLHAKPRLVFAVNDLARRMSNWPVAGSDDEYPEVRFDDDGGNESVACVRRS